MAFWDELFRPQDEIFQPGKAFFRPLDELSPRLGASIQNYSKSQKLLSQRFTT